MVDAALAGLKILDLSGEGPGPFCTMLLGDLGAEITVVDRPSGVSGSKTSPPSSPAMQDLEGLPDAGWQGLARPHFDAFWRNKQRIGVDLKHESGLNVVQRLAAEADVVVVQMRPDKPEALGIGYDDLRAVNSKLIYCMISGFGNTGPLRDQAGHDLNYLGISGVLSLFVPRATPPPAPPNIIADYGAAGMMAATAILAAVQARHATGEGQHIDVSMTDACTYLAAEWMSNTYDPEGDPTLLVDYPPYDVYQCADERLLTIGCVEPHFWATLCKAIDRTDLLHLAGSTDDRQRLRNELQGVFASNTRDVWLARLAAYDIPFGTVNDIDELRDDPHLLAREMVVDIDTEHGQVTQVGIPVKLSATPGSIRRVGVARGADTAKVLAEAGYTLAQIDELLSAGAAFG